MTTFIQESPQPNILPAKKSYFPELDFVKTVGIVMVMAFHFFGELSGWHLKKVEASWFYHYFQNTDFLGIMRFVESYFYLGVNLFVIASGFGLYWSYLKNKQKFSFKEFFKKRILRLMPSAFFAIIFTFFLNGLVLGQWRIDHFYANVFPFLGGLNLFFPQWFFPPIIGDIWFLGLIIQLYLLFPLLVRAVDKMGSRFFLITLFCISIIFRAFCHFYVQDNNLYLSYGLSLGRIFEFGLGIIWAKKIFDQQKISLFWGIGILFFWGYFFPFSYPFADVFMGAGLFSLLWSLGEKIKPSKIFQHISKQSYLMFLLHHPFIWILEKFGMNYFWNWQGLFIFIAFFIFNYFLAKGCNLFLNKLGLE